MALIGIAVTNCETDVPNKKATGDEASGGTETAAKQGRAAWLQGHAVSHSATYLDYYPVMADEDGGMRPGISFDEGAFECEGACDYGAADREAIDKELSKK